MPNFLTFVWYKGLLGWCAFNTTDSGQVCYKSWFQSWDELFCTVWLHLHEHKLICSSGFTHDLENVLHTLLPFGLFVGTPTMTLGGSNIEMDSISVLSSITAPHMYQCKFSAVCWLSRALSLTHSLDTPHHDRQHVSFIYTKNQDLPTEFWWKSLTENDECLNQVKEIRLLWGS
jgi:hypothetical protein